jgi:hypothetical protein
MEGFQLEVWEGYEGSCVEGHWSVDIYSRFDTSKSVFVERKLLSKSLSQKKKFLEQLNPRWWIFSLCKRIKNGWL